MIEDIIKQTNLQAVTLTATVHHKTFGLTNYLADRRGRVRKA